MLRTLLFFLDCVLIQNLLQSVTDPDDKICAHFLAYVDYLARLALFPTLLITFQSSSILRSLSFFSLGSLLPADVDETKDV